MGTYNGKSFSSTKNLNLKGGIIRFAALNSTNPIGSTDYGLYLNGSGSLVLSAAGSTTILSAIGGGGGAVPTFDSLYANDQTMAINSTTFTIDRTNNSTGNVLTVTNTGAGSGNVIQITNAGSGSDIRGHNGTWSISKAGDAVFNKVTFAGDADTGSFTLTVGDFALSDGNMAITNADNEATLTVTNDGATTASVIVFAGSGAFAGDTTSAFMTITPSGLTTGEAVYLPLAAITEGKGLYVLSGTTLTSGALVVIESGAGTAITNTTGALLEVKSGDTAGTNAVLVGMSTAATDETKLLKLTASDALALGNVLNITAGSMTTGSAIVIADMAALTTGQGISILSSATAITTTGRLFYSSATGATSTSGVLNEFIMTQTDETVLLQLSNATAGQVDGCLLNVVQSGVTTHFTGAGSAVARFTGSHTTGSASTVSIVSANTTAGNALLVTASSATTTNARAIKVVAEGLTTGVGIGFEHTTSVIANGGSMVRLSDSGVATGGAANGTILDIINTGSVAGTLVKMYSNCASQTATTILDITQAGATLTAYTDSIVSITGGFSGNSSTGNVLSITSVNTTAGNALLVTASSATTGAGGAIKVVAEGLTTGSGISFVHTTSVIADGGSMLRLTDSGVATGGATSGTMLDILNTGSVAGTLVKIKSNLAAQTATCLLDVVAAGYTTGYTGSVVKITGVSTDGSGNVLLVTGANTSAGNTVKIDAAAVTTGTGLLVTSAGIILTTGELVSLVANAATTCTGVLRISATALTDGWVAELTGGGSTVTSSGGVLNLNAGAATDGYGLKIATSGVYVGTVGMLNVSATAATTGNIVVINGTGLVSGTALLINTTTATLTSGFYLRCNDGAATDFSVGDFGATVIAGSAIGTAALTITQGDIVLGDGTIIYKRKYEDVTGTNAITAAESGTVYFLNAAAEFVTTLPAVATSAGVHYTFIVKAAPAGANYTIVTDSSENKIVAFQNSVAGDAGDSSVFATPDDTISFVGGQSVEGDKVDLYCDGAYWYAYAISKVAAGITFTIAS